MDRAVPEFAIPWASILAAVVRPFGTPPGVGLVLVAAVVGVSVLGWKATVGPFIRSRRLNPSASAEENDFIARLRNHVIARYRWLATEGSTSLPAIFLDSLESATDRTQRGWFLYVQQWRGPEIYQQFLAMTSRLGKRSPKPLVLDAFSSFSLLLYSIRDLNQEFRKFVDAFPASGASTSRRYEQFRESYAAATREGASLVTEWEDRFAGLFPKRV